MNRSGDVAIVGGGVIGCAIAYQLSKIGINCTVFEKNRLASGASGATAGMIGPIWYLDQTPEPYFQLGMRSFEIFPTLVKELEEAGIDPEFQQTGAIKVLFDEISDAVLLDNLKWQRELGIGVRWIDRKELIDREPEITGKAVGGVFSPRDGSIVGIAFVKALAHAATRLGARFFEDVEVMGLEINKDKVIGIRTQLGIYHADHTIICAGPWSGIVKRWLPYSIPVRPIKGQRILLRKSGFLPKSTVQSIVPQKDGSVLSAATREEGNFDQVVTGEAISQMVAKAKEVFPILHDAEFVSASAGVRPGTPDGIPILGPIPGWSGVSLASGHDHVGIMCSPSTAELMADCVATGDCSQLAPFSIERFGLSGS